MTSTAIDILYGVKDRTLMPYLSAYIRQRTDATPGEDILITEDNWEELARGHSSSPVSLKVQKLLENISRRTTVAQWLNFASTDERLSLAAAADIRDGYELSFVVNHLFGAGLLDMNESPPLTPGHEPLIDGLRLTVAGWNYIAPTAGVPGTCFVAMSFDKALNSAYEDGIALSIRDAGFRGGRVDSAPHNDQINDKIRAQIRAAQIVVADFTNLSAGVYYEAGFAEGLGRPVIRTCREDFSSRLHFDTRQFFHLKWTTAADLRTTLTDHIKATIGTGPFMGR
ncbi:MAG: hypothetical protein ABJA98_22150 [Acidobacteriota bacterium]